MVSNTDTSSALAHLSFQSHRLEHEVCPRNSQAGFGWKSALVTGRAHLTAESGSGLDRQPRPSPPPRSHSPALRGPSLSSLARNGKSRLLRRALKGLQAPGATQALQRAGRTTGCPSDSNPGHACPCDSSSARAKPPLPALFRLFFPFVRRGRGAGTTRSPMAGDAPRADGARQGLTLRRGGDRARLGMN